jgi:hypothetical protein
VEFQEQVNMIRYNFHGMNFVALLLANIFEDQLAILFYLPIVEYSVSILGHQHDVVGDLTIAMAETAQFQLLSHPSHRWVAPPVAKAPSTTSLQKEATFYQFKRAQRMGEGSLHPRPEGRGIRDPPHSRCNKITEKMYTLQDLWRLLSILAIIPTLDTQIRVYILVDRLKGRKGASLQLWEHFIGNHCPWC